MPINLDAIDSRLIDAARNGTLVPFIGSGISKQARTADPGAFPTWTELIEALMVRARERGELDPEEYAEMKRLLDRGKHLMVAEELKHLLGDDFERIIEKRCAPPDAEPGEVHRRLFDLKCPLVVTTNYDSLLEDACASTPRRNAIPYTFDHAANVQHQMLSSRAVTSKPVIFKIHGGIDQDRKKLVLTESDYRKLLYHEPGYRTILSAIFVTRVVLMLGFSFSDPELTVMTESIRESLKKGSHTPDYLVLPKGEKGKIEIRRLREDFGIEVIEYEATPGHPELLELINYLVSCVETASPTPLPSKPLRAAP